MKAVIALTVALMPMAPLAGQRVSGRAVIAAPKNSVRLPGMSERLGGVWAGLALDVGVGRFTVSATGTRGRLTPAEVASFGRDVGEASLSGRYEVPNAVGLELRYIARAFSSPVGYQRWDILGVGATVAHDLGSPAVHAVATLAYLPIVELRGVGRTSFALSSDVGLTVAPPRLPVAFLVSYRVERFSFNKLSRREQFETLTLSVGPRLRGVEGRWTFGGAGRGRRTAAGRAAS